MLFSTLKGVLYNEQLGLLWKKTGRDAYDIQDEIQAQFKVSLSAAIQPPAVSLIR